MSGSKSLTTKLSGLLISDKTSGHILGEDPSISKQEHEAAEAFFGPCPFCEKEWHLCECETPDEPNIWDEDELRYGKD